MGELFIKWKSANLLIFGKICPFLVKKSTYLAISSEKCQNYYLFVIFGDFWPKNRQIGYFWWKIAKLAIFVMQIAKLAISSNDTL